MLSVLSLNIKVLTLDVSRLLARHQRCRVLKTEIGDHLRRDSGEGVDLGAQIQICALVGFLLLGHKVRAHLGRAVELGHLAVVMLVDQDLWNLVGVEHGRTEISSIEALVQSSGGRCLHKATTTEPQTTLAILLQ